MGPSLLLNPSSLRKSLNPSLQSCGFVLSDVKERFALIIFFQLYTFPSKRCLNRFQATIEEVLTTMTHEMMPYTMERVYLLDPVKRNEYFLRDTRSLVDLGITDNTVFCLLSFVRSFFNASHLKFCF